MFVSEFNYNLPKELIAQYPVERRDNSRLLVLNRKNGEIRHKIFYEIIDFINKGDLIILNNSKVFPARLFGKKEKTLGKIEILLSRILDNGNWEVKGKGLKIGKQINFDGDLLKGEVISKNEDVYEISFNIHGEEFFDELERIGKMPLPPYINRKDNCRNSVNTRIKDEDFDKERYQTVYAKELGSIAAPTAGLHFTEKLLNDLALKGIQVEYLTLHVGLGTFLPVATEKLSDHKMHEELFTLEKALMRKIKQTKKNGGRVIAVGTTTARVLESVYNPELSEQFNVILEDSDSKINGRTNIFIYPPYKFKCVDAMVTNFHLPKSTLMMIVSAFSSTDIVKNSYKIAVENKYKFFSYGDAMLII